MLQPAAQPSGTATRFFGARRRSESLARDLRRIGVTARRNTALLSMPTSSRTRRAPRAWPVVRLPQRRNPFDAADPHDAVIGHAAQAVGMLMNGCAPTWKRGEYCAYIKLDQFPTIHRHALAKGGEPHSDRRNLVVVLLETVFGFQKPEQPPQQGFLRWCVDPLHFKLALPEEVWSGRRICTRPRNTPPVSGSGGTPRSC